VARQREDLGDRVRILADLQISPRTVAHLRALGHEVVRVTDLLPATASDETIVACAIQERRVILTQDLDFTSIVALSGRAQPSIVSVRLTSSRVEAVNAVLGQALGTLEPVLRAGALVTIEDSRVRSRALPLL
jgi:predicted nuclease of predicted toxin-antitoxin system